MKTEKLLTREEFNKQCRQRDGDKCVICKNPATEVHHIFDRKLFPDGGYYISNGCTVCSEHHIEAEKCDLTIEEIRTAAGITDIILPEGLKPGIVYDKWGQEVDEGIISRKYGRTYHFNFSPGTTSDDRISHNHWEYISKIKRFILTEKLDGENNCLSEYGVFARSHAAPTESRWTQDIRQRWHSIKHDLKGGIQIFLENTYAIHSIEYKNIEQHYYIFAVRENGRCMCWEEVKFWADALDFPTVPVLEIIEPAKFTEIEFKNKVESLAQEGSKLQSHNHLMNEIGTIINNDPCTREGIVGANMDEYLMRDFDKNVFKYVRAKHVKTDKHWTQNWKRAQLLWEKK